MKIKIMKCDTGCCALDCEFKKDDWCNLFFAELFGELKNPTRFPSCIMLTNTDAEFSSQRFEIERDSICFGCNNYREGNFNNCTAGIMCAEGHLNRYKHLNRYE